MKGSTKYLKLLLNILIIIGLLLVILYVIPKIVWFFFPFVIGWLLSVIANPLVKFLEKRLKMVRKHSSMMIIIGVLALIFVGGYFAIAKIGGEVISLLNNLPQIYENTTKEFNQVGDNLQVVFERLPKDSQQQILEVQKDLATYLGSTIGEIGKPTMVAAGNFAKNLPSGIISTIMAILSAYFFIADREKIIGLINKHTPYSIRKNIELISHDFGYAVGGYFKAQFKIMFVVAVILLIGFWILGVNYAILLALLISFLDFLPFFGTGTALVPWAVMKFLAQDYKLAIGLMIIYVVSQLVRQLIQPKIVGDSIGLNPLLTLIFLYIGYKIKGMLGMILAIPIGMIFINLCKNGIFDNIVRNVKEVWKDIEDFRRM